MLDYSPLYPCANSYRSSLCLDGMWKFQFDPQGKGLTDDWKEGLPAPINMPVPSSFSELFTEVNERDYCGDFWYETEFYIPSECKNRKAYVRFGSITHRAKVFCNGILVAEHEGGFLPIVADVTDHVTIGIPNKLTVWVNNEVNETSLPCGIVREMKDGRKLAKPYFDFFNYSGIQRSVYLVCTPREAILDYSTKYELNDSDAKVHYSVISEIKEDSDMKIQVMLYDRDGNYVTEASGSEGTLTVKNAHLWRVRNSYLYKIVIRIIQQDNIIDEYSDFIGIRTVEIRGTKFIISGEEIYLKGFGKHEDFEILGRSFNWSILKRDFECMKWTGANCFRTSHYPYAEEWYRYADQEGFLIIDEVPAVGMMRSTHNFVAAGTGKYTYFFETPTTPTLKAAHLRDIEEMIARDKNHPSVFAWSLFNEPETTSDCAKEYFTDIFSFARTMDPQNRPMTGALEKNSSPDKCKCYPLLDFICLNRYYGWYINGGNEIDEAMELFHEEMDQWQAKKLNVPFVFTEFGTDTLSCEHKLPAVMWSQEYQSDYLSRNFEVFDSYDFVQGELVWNFADFQTSEGIFRVNGNKKGVFTRTRQPKDAAFVLKKRWQNLDYLS